MRNSFRRWHTGWLLIVLLVLPTACQPTALAASEEATTASPASALTATPQPAAYAHTSPRAWIVTDPTSLIQSLPPPGDLPAVPPAPVADVQAPWKQPVVAWMNIELEAIKREQTTPPRAARALALLAVGMSDSLIAAETARAEDMEIDTDALLVGAALRILRYNHPTISGYFEEQARTATFIGAWRNRATRAAIEGGLRLGCAVGEAVVASAQQDGADTYLSPELPKVVPGVWQPTAPMFALPLEPGWGRVKPFVIASGSSVPAAPPPTWDAPTFKQERAAFLVIQQQLTDADKALATKWAGAAGSVTPPGLWVELTRELVQRNALSTEEAAHVFASVTIAMHDAFIACWASKFQYMVARPITWMHEAQPNWKSYIKTPPFPSYPSGHATISGAAATVLTAYFPASAGTLQQDAEDAAHSRIVGGIHWSIDSTAGLDQGRRVGELIVKQLQGES